MKSNRGSKSWPLDVDDFPWGMMNTKSRGEVASNDSLRELI